jgi:1-acyl-sn-glycerol-3-phosphate acyltransferase
MNCERTQKRYEFCPPLYARWFRPVCHLLSAAFLRFKFNIRQVTIRGEAPLLKLVRTGQSMLVAPNHADHADPSILVEVGRRSGIAFQFMAAREGFERSRLDRFVLQRSGAFSVDREGADLASVRTAMDILRECRRPLVIFPEGEIYHHHEELDLLNDGVATILLRAAEKLPEGKRSYAVPAAIRIMQVPEVEPTFSPRLSALEQRITWKPRPHVPIVERIYSLGSALLSIKEEEYTGECRKGPLPERIQALQQHLLAEVEKRHRVNPSPQPIPVRIRNLRHTIRKGFTFNPTSLSAERARMLYDDLDRLFAAQQLYSYPGQYLHLPTRDRIAETIFKMEEDVLGLGTYPTPRRAEITFGEPIDVAQFLVANHASAKTGVRPMTELLRARIEQLLKGASRLR